MKFSGKMCLMIILKVTKKPGLHPLFRRYNFRNIAGGFKLTPLTPSYPPAVLELMVTNACLKILLLCLQYLIEIISIKKIYLENSL